MKILNPFLSFLISSFIKRKKLRLLIVVFVFIFILLFFFYLYRAKRPTKVKEENIAIIFVPGIGISGLFNTSPNSLKYKQNTNIWLYGNEYAMGNFWSNEESKKNILDNNYLDFCCNQFGNPINTDIKALNTVEGGMKSRDTEMLLYGYCKMFEQPIEKLKHYLSLYSEKNIHVFMFNYDWRLSVAKNGILLKEKIKEYSDVIIIAYSLGGLVTIHAFQGLEEDCALSKVKGFIACGVPFLGSYVACSALKDGSGIADTIFTPSDTKKKLRNVCRNYSSLYDLLPCSLFSAAFLNDKENLKKLVNFDFNPRLFAKAFSNYKKRSTFNWYDNKVKNIYIINSDVNKKDLDIDDFRLLTNNPSKYVPGDGSVAYKSSYPFFLTGYVKDSFIVKVPHERIMSNASVHNKIMEYTGKILNIQKDSNDTETLECMLKLNGFHS